MGNRLKRTSFWVIEDEAEMDEEVVTSLDLLLILRSEESRSMVTSWLTDAVT